MDDQWPQRLVFRQLVDAYKKRADLTSEQLAPLLGIKPQSLHKYLYGRTKRPGRKVLIQAAGLFGCSLGELFLDTPQANIPEGLGPVDQFRFDTMVEKMNGADLTAKDRQILFEDGFAFKESPGEKQQAEDSNPEPPGRAEAAFEGMEDGGSLHGTSDSLLAHSLPQTLLHAGG